MILSNVVAVVVVLAAADPAPPPPPAVLQGIDSLPAPAVVRSTETRALTVMALADKQKPLHRARAIRLLGARADVDEGVFVTLRNSPLPELRVHAALAQGAVAARQDQLVPFAAGLLHDDDPELRRAALTLLWVERSGAARDVVFAFARSEPDPALQQLMAHRLKGWPTTWPEKATAKRRR